MASRIEVRPPTNKKRGTPVRAPLFFPTATPKTPGVIAGNQGCVGSDAFDALKGDHDNRVMDVS